MNELISSFGGCLLLYENLLDGTSSSVETNLIALKEEHTAQLKSALNLEKFQSFSVKNLELYELLQSVARGEKIINKESFAAKYLLAKHGDIQAFLGIHPEGHLIFALPMTKKSLNEVDHLVKIRNKMLLNK